jgi:hypothetical protein
MRWRKKKGTNLMRKSVLDLLYILNFLHLLAGAGYRSGASRSIRGSSPLVLLPGTLPLASLEWKASN